MGKLLSLLARDDSTCCAPQRYEVFLDFENAAPTDTERDVYEDVQRVLKDSESVLEEIQNYKVKINLLFKQMQVKKYNLFKSHLIHRVQEKKFEKR